ncbi:MAG TPA: hypothetical protein VEY94_04860, partial [Patescibacteria group bacterium]|nr:hypothetical protein [Patescibacteria group bacterium]
TVRAHGRVLVTLAEPLGTGGLEPMLDAMRAALVRHGLATAAGDRYETYDLMIVIPPAMRIYLNALELEDGRIAFAWRALAAWRRIAITGAAIAIAMLATGFSGAITIATVAAAGLVAAVLAVLHLSRLPAALKAAAADATATLGARAHVEEDAA